MVRALAFGLAAVLGFLLLATVLRTTDVLTGSPDATRLGTATVSSCVEHGPVGWWGIGGSFECTANVRWDDGTTESVRFAPGQLEPGETDVAVFDSGREPGRNDSARWFLAGPVVVVALGLLTVWFAAATVGMLIPRRPGRRSERTEKWPVTKAEIAATPVPRRVRRVRLLAWLGLGAGALEVLASIPFFDAPRRLGTFVSPWPGLEQAWLVDPPSGVLAGFGALLAALLGVLASVLHRDAARVVRYGQSYVDTKRISGGSSWVPTVILVALVAWAVVTMVRAMPAGAPVLVWFAGARDVLISLALLVIVVGTRQSAKDMVDRLVQFRGNRDPADSV